MIKTYKLMTGKYDHKIVNFKPKQHDSSTSLPTQGHQLKLYKGQRRTHRTISLVFESQAIGTVSQTILFNHQTSRHLKVDWTNTGRNMKENTTLEVPTAPLLTEGQNMKKPLKKKEL